MLENDMQWRNGGGVVWPVWRIESRKQMWRLAESGCRAGAVIKQKAVAPLSGVSAKSEGRRRKQRSLKWRKRQRSERRHRQRKASLAKSNNWLAANRKLAWQRSNLKSAAWRKAFRCNKTVALWQNSRRWW
jgi:hypothetical protein